MSVRINRLESAFTGLTGGNPPHLPNLVDEVNDNVTITTVCHDAQWDIPEAPREIALIFDSTPPGPELTELDSTVIPNHTGADIGDAAIPSGGTWVTEAITTQTVTGSDTALTDTLSNDPDTATVILKFDGLSKDQGAGNTYTLGGTGNRTITWLASSGDAEDMDTNDVIEVTYRIA